LRTAPASLRSGDHEAAGGVVKEQPHGELRADDDVQQGYRCRFVMPGS
jgi:hypothetical protein